LRKTAELCWQKSHYAAQVLGALPGCSVSPESGEGLFFKEFVLKLPFNAESASEDLFKKGIVMGLPLSRYYPERDKEVLVCVTEKNSKSDIDAYAAALASILPEVY
jgi:glycine dehydrogenase subunit 1